MRKSTIPFLLTSIFFVVLMVSCGSNPIRKLPKIAVENGVFKVAYFADPEIDYVYKTNITVYGNELSGIFIAKKIDDLTHRVVFTTEFGNKLLDFEISQDDFKVNAIVEELDRKILVHTLVDDFRLLLRENYSIQHQYENIDEKILESKDGNRYNYLYVSKTGGKLNKVVHSTKRKEKINITFISENNIFAHSIVVQHFDIKLKIVFNHFTNQN